MIKKPAPGHMVYDVAHLVAASHQVVRRAINSGSLKAHKFGPKCVRIMPEDLADWIKRSVKPPKPSKAKKPEMAG